MNSTNFKGLKQTDIFKYVMFVLVAVLITFLTPTGRSNFQYQFAMGKPWQYSLLTAPYDIPIYKSSAKINHEKDSVRQSVIPIYTLEEDVELLMLEELQSEYTTSLKDLISLECYNYIKATLHKFYKQGLIEQTDLSSLRQSGHLEVRLLSQGNVLRKSPITKFYTLREAYQYITEYCPKNIDKSELTKIKLANYLKTNLFYSQELTEKMIDDELRKISLSSGIIQRGERIIDKGDIVTHYTYELLNSLVKEEAKRTGTDTLWKRFVLRLGTMLCLSILFLVLAVYLHHFMPTLFRQTKNITFWLSLITVFVALTAYNEYYDLFNRYIVPYVMVIILMRTFFDSYTALIVYIVVLLASAFFVADPLSFILLEFIAGMVALLVLQNFSSRNKLLNATFLVFITYTLLFLALTLMQGGEINSSYWLIEAYFGVNFMFLVFSYGLADAIERLFGYVSNVSLVELSDMNSPLLRELSEKAPGTAQHSQQVAILASEAAKVIGANAPLVRTGALYHDIGKLKNPSYFTENQGINNPHNLLPYKESAAIIVRHVTDGIALAQKHKLPNRIIEFIQTHHGKSVTRYFYYSYCNEHPDENVDKSAFQYPGPNPWTKEQGILMLADAVEASSRSLPEHTEEGIQTLMEKVVDGIVSEGLLEDTPLTFNDIKRIKKVFFEKLKTMYHSRIAYPEKNDDAQ